MSDAGNSMRVAVLLGGSSEERSVSLASGCEVAAALRSAGHEISAIDAAVGPLSLDRQRAILDAGIVRAASVAPAPPSSRVLPEAEVIARQASAPDSALAGADVAFLALHGGAGEDGTIQTLLRTSGIVFAGSTSVGCTLAMDKDLSKRLFRDADVATPDWMIGAAPGEAVAARLGLPVVVKPVSGGSSVRLVLAGTPSEVDEGTRVAGGGGDMVMYERYVRGREFTVGILDRAPLPVVEIEPVREFFDFDCKYEQGMALETAPARIPHALAVTLQSIALRVHDLLRLRHYSRVDFMVDDDGRPWCLEANALPGLTANSLMPKAALAAGIEFPDLCERICRLGRGDAAESLESRESPPSSTSAPSAPSLGGNR